MRAWHEAAHVLLRLDLVPIRPLLRALYLRYYRDLTAIWGYDAYQDTYFFGYRSYAARGARAVDRVSGGVSSAGTVSAHDPDRTRRLWADGGR